MQVVIKKINNYYDSWMQKFYSKPMIIEILNSWYELCSYEEVNNNLFDLFGRKSLLECIEYGPKMIVNRIRETYPVLPDVREIIAELFLNKNIPNYDEWLISLFIYDHVVARNIIELYLYKWTDTLINPTFEVRLYYNIHKTHKFVFDYISLYGCDFNLLKRNAFYFPKYIPDDDNMLLKSIFLYGDDRFFVPLINYGHRLRDAPGVSRLSITPVKLQALITSHKYNSKILDNFLVELINNNSNIQLIKTVLFLGATMKYEYNRPDLLPFIEYIRPDSLYYLLLIEEDKLLVWNQKAYVHFPEDSKYYHITPIC